MRQFKLFISYAHADFEPRPGLKDSRVGRILADIKYELGCHSPRSPFQILRDVEIMNISDNFRQKIQDAISQCDMALVFISSHYCVSEECEQEFVQLIDAGKTLFLINTEEVWLADDQNRIKRHRERVKDILWAHFFGLKDQKTVLYGYPLPDRDLSTQDKYYDEVQRLSNGLKTRARELLGVTREEGDSERRYDVFMACPTPDMKPQADRLVAALEQDGHSIRAFDLELDVRNADSFDEVAAKALAQCDVYVQLLGMRAGRQVPGSSFRLARAQYDVAVKSGKPVYVWRASDFETAECEADYGAFLTAIELTCHRGNFHEFEGYLQKKLADIVAQRQSEKRRAQRLEQQDTDAPRPQVAIDAALADRGLALKIASAIDKYVDVGHLGYELNGKELAEAVADNNALILAYGESAEGQKRAQAHFKIVRRRKAEADFKGLELAVGDGAPATAPPCPRGPNVHIITVGEHVDSGAMIGFLKRLGITLSQGNEAR